MVWCAPSGAIPRRTNGSVSLAPVQTKRKSQGSCRPVMPRPAACPLTAAIVIFRQRKMASVILPPGSLSAERAAGGGVEKISTKGRRRLQRDKLTMPTLPLVFFGKELPPTSRNIRLRLRREGRKGVALALSPLALGRIALLRRRRHRR